MFLGKFRQSVVSAKVSDRRRVVLVLLIRLKTVFSDRNEASVHEGNFCSTVLIHSIMLQILAFAIQCASKTIKQHKSIGSSSY